MHKKILISIAFITTSLFAYNNVFYANKTNISTKSYNKNISKISLNQFLKLFSKYHANFYNENYLFVLDPKINAEIYIDKNQADILIKQDLKTLKTFLENKIGIKLKFNIINADNNKIVYIVPQQNKNIYNNDTEKMINDLYKIDNKAKNLKNFNYKAFHKEMLKMILKLKTYQEIEN